MREFVMNVINISGQAAIIFVVLLAVRGIFALGRVPKKYAYGLWAILFIRLLLPIQMEAGWGLMPRESGLARAVESMADAAGQDASSNWQSMYEGQDIPANWRGMYEGQNISLDWQSMYRDQDIPNGQSLFGGQDTFEDWYHITGAGQDAQPVWLKGDEQAREKHIESGRSLGEKDDAEKSVLLVGRRGQTAGNGNMETQKGQSAALAGDISSRQFSMWSIIIGIWVTGSVLLMGYGLFSYFRLKRKLCCSLRLEGWGEGIYLADGIETPFVLGFIAPRIYLPSSMADKNYPYVIAHERTHIRRRDYWIKLGACLLTCLYWFHPLVWAGFILMNRDMEMSCDEAVLRRMGGDRRGEYADCLLQLTCGRHYPVAAPLAFGEGDTRGRIRHIMGYRKAAAAMAIGAVALTGILAAVLLVSPQKVAARDDGDSRQDSSSLEQTKRTQSETGMSLEQTVGTLSKAGTPLELTEGNPYGESMEQTDDGISGKSTTPMDNHASVGNGGQEFSFQVAYRDIVSCPLPVMTGNTSLGADGAILDYADGDKVIFHGYFGLYIYSASAGETIGAVDLQALGCGDTQGDNTCQVLVSKDGAKVYFYPLGGIDEVQGSDQGHTGSWHRLTTNGEPVATIKSLDQGEQGHVIYSYVYDVPSGRLRIASWNLGQLGDDAHREIDFSQLMGEELAQGRAVPVAELEPGVWEQGFCSYHGMVFERDGERVFGYLKSASETLEDLVYVQGPVYMENPANVQKPGEEEKPDAVTGGGDWREAVRLFGANGQGISTVSYDRRETTPWITIDGITYDLGQAMTQCRYGDGTMESPYGNTDINAITGLQCVDGFWIVEGHMNPKHGTYSFYDPAAGKWVCHIVADCITWDNRDEKLPLWEGNRENRLSTVIYALDNIIYSLQDGQLTAKPLESAKGGTESLPQEEICGLHRNGNEITVEFRSTQTEERRTVQFHYSRSTGGSIKLDLNE